VHNRKLTVDYTNFQKKQTTLQKNNSLSTQDFELSQITYFQSQMKFRMIQQKSLSPNDGYITT